MKAILNRITSDYFTFVMRGVLFLLIWHVLTNGNMQSWWIGVPAVLLAAISSILLVQPASFVWHRFLRFIPFFQLHSLLGGLDVARRAYDPRMPISPKLIEFPLLLPIGLPRVFLINIINLLPGTLCVDHDRNLLTIHVLDRRKEFLTELTILENKVAWIFALSLNTTEGK